MKLTGRVVRGIWGLLPVLLVVSPEHGFDGQPLGDATLAENNTWLIDLSDNLPAGGILEPGETTSGRTVTISSPNRAADITVARDDGPPQPYDGRPIVLHPEGGHGWRALQPCCRWAYGLRRRPPAPRRFSNSLVRLSST